MSEPTTPADTTDTELELQEPGDALEAKSAELTLYGMPVKISRPKSLAERYAVAQLPHGTLAQPLSIGCAIGLCWMKLRGRLQSEGITYKGRPAEFGERVFEWLYAQDNAPTYDQLAAVYVEAIRVCSEDLPGLVTPGSQEAKRLVGNSGEEEGSTSTS